MVITIMSYNVRHCRGIDLKVNIDRIIDTITSIKPDIVCLQEVYEFDSKKFKRRQASVISDAINMSMLHEPSVKLGRISWGVTILSRHNITQRTPIKLPYSTEPRIHQRAMLHLDGSDVEMHNTHLAFSRRERLKQFEVLKQQFNPTNPTIICGDFNANFSELNQAFTADSIVFEEALTFPARKPRRALDNIIISPHFKVLDRRIVTSLGSDHLPIVARLEY